MNVNEPFELSHEQMKPLVKYTQLLLAVQQRVSSSKPTSAKVPHGRGLLDKLEIRLVAPLDVETLNSRCKSLGYKLEGSYKKDKRFYLSIQFGTNVIDCYMCHPENKEIRKIILNPSKFNCWFEIEAFLILIFTSNILEADIYRIDFTFDVFQEFQKVLEGLKINHKRANSEFLGGSVRTGLIVGTGNDKYNIYNKAAKEKSNLPWTRIERQISGKILFIKKIKDLRDSSDLILKFNPFSEVQLNHLKLNDPALFPNNREKYDELKFLVKHEGYFLSRKKLSKNNNFDRDYGEFFQLIPHSIQPSNIFNKDIINFFKEPV